MTHLRTAEYGKKESARINHLSGQFNLPNAPEYGAGGAFRDVSDTICHLKIGGNKRSFNQLST